MEKNELVKLWYKNAVFYAVIVESFKDGNGDGIGDFVGLCEKLDYLQDLGITCIWILPFYPTAQRDNGYDIINHCEVDPRLGTLDDFKTFVKEAKKRNIKVIIDLVVNHTSDKHPWFEDAIHNKNSKYKEYYIWTKEVPEKTQPNNAFPGIEAGVWQYEAGKKEFFYHSFYRFEPDLNMANPQVRKEIRKIMDFWMSLGIDGFRMDAVFLMFQKKGVKGTGVDDPGPILEEWNEFVKNKNPLGVILGEVDVKLDKLDIYFGSGGRVDVMFNFLLNRYLFLGFARNDGETIRKFLAKLPVPPPAAQWANFLRNHDELNIDLLTKSEKKEVFDQFAPDPGMVVYDRGIRRRLAPMFGENVSRLKMAYSLLFGLPGSEMILYGDEIGMSDDLRLPERMSVRLPMQWSAAHNGGFSSAHESTMIRTVKAVGSADYKKLNVSSQEKDKKSLLNHIKQLIHLQKDHPELGHGMYKLPRVNTREVFAILYEFEGKKTLILNNLCETPCTVSIDLLGDVILTEFYSDGNYKKEEFSKAIKMNSYGYRWFEVKNKKKIS